jgi:signal transduction histidine kinase
LIIILVPILNSAHYFTTVTNGIEYQSNERACFIKLHTTFENNYVILHVQDNGIGIDLKNRDKLFGMYKTFHNNKMLEESDCLSVRTK